MCSVTSTSARPNCADLNSNKFLGVAELMRNDESREHEAGVVFADSALAKSVWHGVSHDSRDFVVLCFAARDPWPCRQSLRGDHCLPCFTGIVLRWADLDSDWYLFEQAPASARTGCAYTRSEGSGSPDRLVFRHYDFSQRSDWNPAHLSC